MTRTSKRRHISASCRPLPTRTCRSSRRRPPPSWRCLSHSSTPVLHSGCGRCSSSGSSSARQPLRLEPLPGAASPRGSLLSSWHSPSREPGPSHFSCWARLTAFRRWGWPPPMRRGGEAARAEPVSGSCWDPRWRSRTWRWGSPSGWWRAGSGAQWAAPRRRWRCSRLLRWQPSEPAASAASSARWAWPSGTRRRPARWGSQGFSPRGWAVAVRQQCSRLSGRAWALACARFSGCGVAAPGPWSCRWRVLWRCRS